MDSLGAGSRSGPANGHDRWQARVSSRVASNRSLGAPPLSRSGVQGPVGVRGGQEGCHGRCDPARAGGVQPRVRAGEELAARSVGPAEGRSPRPRGAEIVRGSSQVERIWAPTPDGSSQAREHTGACLSSVLWSRFAGGRAPERRRHGPALRRERGRARVSTQCWGAALLLAACTSVNGLKQQGPHTYDLALQVDHRRCPGRRVGPVVQRPEGPGERGVWGKCGRGAALRPLAQPRVGSGSPTPPRHAAPRAVCRVTSRTPTLASRSTKQQEPTEEEEQQEESGMLTMRRRDVPGRAARTTPVFTRSGWMARGSTPRPRRQNSFFMS